MENTNTVDFDPLKLDNQLCFPLYACAKEVVRRYTPFLNEIDLTYTQYITMMVMWECKSLSVRELGEKLLLDSGTLTPLLKKLEAKGLVIRERSHEDERKLNVVITEKGEALRSRALGVPRQMGKCVGLSKEDAMELRRLLNKIIDNVRQEER
ncbi:MarR family winged helix-turn-helix transcriptional regulator [Slackia heliotrinireducens]|uniref:MarR family winged helix-turn-helix transcriptional regulator n=1 Tax=Slackia heliotrinireducens TaxID=84110 RepID=UPI00331516AB